MFIDLLASQLDLRFVVLAATVLVAGIARGLSGFGNGMIIAPIAAALYGPQTAVVLIVLIDVLPTIPVTVPALKVARWSEVLPCLVGTALFLPVGVLILKHADGESLRWCISIAILLVTAAMWSGWRYHGPRNLAISLSVGGVSGILSGIASMPGPPVIIYWMASALPAFQVRANLLALLLTGDVLSFANLSLAGLIDMPRLALALVTAPFYFCGLLAGWALYGRSSDATYRRVTFCLIVAAAVLAMPPTRHVFTFLTRLVS